MSVQNRTRHTTPIEGVTISGKITIPGGLPYATNYGPILHSQLNRVKRTVESFAGLYGLDLEYLKKVIQRQAPLTPEILIAIERHTPLSARELIAPSYRASVPLSDDSNGSGVVVFHADATERTRRTTQRGPDGQKVDYYDYFDTVMQRFSPILPEYIIEHYEHNGDDAELPDWAFNNGHRERQITVAIGHVNYHWIDQYGKKHVRATNEGDANFITPFTRHSFTRRPGQYAAILAATDLGAIGIETFQETIQSLDLEQFLSMMKMKIPRLDASLSTDAFGGFIFREYKDALLSTDSSLTADGAYEVRMLMDGIPFHPNFKASEYHIRQQGEPERLDLVRDAHRWGFNWGNDPIILYWGSECQELEPKSSFSIQRFVPHAIRNIHGGTGRIIITESYPDTEDSFSQLALIARYSGQRGIERVHSEMQQWF